MDQQTTQLDMQCISWILQTSLDTAVRLLALEYLAAMVTLADFDPTLVVDCFTTFAGCVRLIKNTASITQGSERLATASATCLHHTISHLSVVDPKSCVLGDVRWRYRNIFPPRTNFNGLPFFHTLGAIHELLNQTGDVSGRILPDWQLVREPVGSAILPV